MFQIRDNQIYGGSRLTFKLPDGTHLVVEAANGCRPDIRPVGRWHIYTPEKDEARMTLNGLLVEGSLQVCGDVELAVVHCTLAPGRTLKEDGRVKYPDLNSVVAQAIKGRCKRVGQPGVTIDHSIAGPIRMPADSKHLTIRDSIVDAPKVGGAVRPAIAASDVDISHGLPAIREWSTYSGPPATIERTTIFGPVYLKELTLASEVIFTDLVLTERRQAGCVRFSYVPEGSQTPRRYRCQPDLALEDVPCPSEQTRIRAWLKPSFTSADYGHPAYAQLSLTCAEEIRTGAENGSEMGAFSHLKQPQREANLRIRLKEYLPFGLEAGLIYVT